MAADGAVAGVKASVLDWQQFGLASHLPVAIS
jgi:hypothetical protein